MNVFSFSSHIAFSSSNTQNNVVMQEGRILFCFVLVVVQKLLDAARKMAMRARMRNYVIKIYMALIKVHSARCK